MTQTGPVGFDLLRLLVNHTNDALDLNYEDVCGGTVPIPSSVTVDLTDNLDGAVIWFKQCDAPPPPPPPSDCVGLTPGFWKNWANHYTPSQFATLLDGTSSASLTNQQATAVLSANNPALKRLKKFLLANELTISLTGSPYPNPSGGSMAGSCILNGKTLAEAIALAKAIIANPGGYTNQQIIAAGTVLDNFANMN